MFKTKQATVTEPLTPEQELQKLSQVVVARVQELAAMRDAVEAAERAVRAQSALSVVPQLYCSGLWQVLAAVERAWTMHRRDLVSDGPPPPDPLAVAIVEARANVGYAEKQIAYYETLLSEPGAAQDARLMGFAQNWISNLKAARGRLGDLLAQRPQDRATRAERMDLLEPVAGLHIAA